LMSCAWAMPAPRVASVTAAAMASCFSFMVYLLGVDAAERRGGNKGRLIVRTSA
jgi:hypothetical protein